MYIILGASGHVGSAVAQTLLDQGKAVTVILHDPKKTDEWAQKGAAVALADVHDRVRLHAAFRRGKRLFLLNPPASPSTDTVQEERKRVAAILAALPGSGLEKIVAQSTYGAQPGDQLGDLGVLYELEQKLTQTGIPTSLIRAAYYMSNWDMALTTAQQQGVVHTLYPPDLKLPMVAPHDIGRFAARLLTEPVETTSLRYVEGPAPYSSADVAAAFAASLNKPVEAVETPRDQWVPALMTMGFSQQAADSMAAMTAVTLETLTSNGFVADRPERGATTLAAYIHELVATSADKAD